MTGLEFPQISPIIFAIGPIAIRWYSMAYLLGLLFSWFYIGFNIKKYKLNIDAKRIEDIIFYAAMGMIIGGRMGYVIFYGGDLFWKNPLQIFAVWEGGMSFHGGAVGSVLGVLYSCRKYKIDFWQLADLSALCAPVGLFLGRVANFINDELWGRVTDVAWAVRFPSGGYLPRHPSQLYEAALEGVAIFVILNLLYLLPTVRVRKGTVSALFVLLYATFRTIVENFREPDAHIGFLWGSLTMGQLLSLPLVVYALYLLYKRTFKYEA